MPFSTPPAYMRISFAGNSSTGRERKAQHVIERAPTEKALQLIPFPSFPPNSASSQSYLPLCRLDDRQPMGPLGTVFMS